METFNINIQLKECIVIPYSTIYMSEDMSIHSVSTYRGKERYDSVLLNTNSIEPPWGCIREIFTFNYNNEITEWILVQKYQFIDK